jgi:hypothetical protein
MAMAMLASAFGVLPEEDAEVVGDVAIARIMDAKVHTNLYEFKEDNVTLTRFTAFPINAYAAYAAIDGLSTVPGGISMGIGTPTEGTIAGINLGTTGSIVGSPPDAPPGSITVTNATVTSIDDGVAEVTSVTAPDSITVTPGGRVSFNPGA